MKRRRSSKTLEKTNMKIDMFFKTTSKEDLHDSIKRTSSKIISIPSTTCLQKEDEMKTNEIINLDDSDSSDLKMIEMIPKHKKDIQVELSTEETIVYDWIEKEVNYFHQYNHYSKRNNKTLCILYKTEICTIETFCEMYSIEHIYLSIEEIIDYEENHQNEMKVETLRLFEIEISTEDEINNLIEEFDLFPEGMYVLNCSIVTVGDYSSIIPSIGLFLPLKDSIEYLSEELKLVVKKEKQLKMNKIQIQKLFNTFIQIPYCFFYLLHCFSLCLKGICHFSFQNELFLPFQLLNQFSNKQLSIEQMIVYSQRNDDLKNCVFWQTQSICSIDSLERIIQIYQHFILMDLFSKIKEKWRSDNVKELIIMHSVIIPYYYTKKIDYEIDEMNSNEMEEEKEMNDISEISKIDDEDEEYDETDILNSNQSTEEENENINEENDKNEDEEINDVDNEKEQIEINKQFQKYQKKQNELKEKQQKITNCKSFFKNELVSKKVSLSVVFPTIMNILLKAKIKSKKDKQELKDSLSHFNFNGKTWKTMIENSVYKVKFNKCSKTRRNFILELFEEKDSLI